MKIFISYRRDDSADICGRIYDRLVQRFGKENVFKDVDSIPLGVDFAEYIAGVVAQCQVQLVVIGQRWLENGRRFGQSRLDDPNDFVRLEVEAALARHIPVIPLLVQQAPIPPANRLPASIRDLVKHNGLPVRPDPDFEHDISRVLSAVEHWMAQPQPSGDMPSVAADTHPAQDEQYQALAGARPVSAQVTTPPPLSTAIPFGGMRASAPSRVGPPRRALSVALIAAVLVVLLFGVALLTSHRDTGGTTLSRSDSAGTMTAARQDASGTATAASLAATQTAFATTAYRAHVPGQGCDPGIADWSKSDSAVLQCLPDHTVMSVSGGDIGILTFYSPFSHQARLPAHYTTSVSVAFTAPATTDDMCAILDDKANWGIWLCRDGSWRVEDNWWPTRPEGNLGVHPSYKLSATIQHGAVSLSINDTVIATQNGATFDDDTTFIDLSLFAVHYDPKNTASVYFSDFVFSPSP